MSRQYLYTSAKRGLEPGKSGFCCVARDRDLPPDLLQELEQQSRFHHSGGEPAPVIMRHRRVTLRSGAYHILTRIQDAGADYSKRNNHLAHHIVFDPKETDALPNPAIILLRWTGWRSQWHEPPRMLAAEDAFHLQSIDSRSGLLADPEHFFLNPPFADGAIQRRVFELAENEPLALVEHLRGWLNELPVEERWRYPFTSLLLPTDQPSDYVWSATRRGQSLPFELDFLPRPLESEPATRQPPEPLDAAEPKLDAAERSEPQVEQPVLRKIQAPVVEIPVEFDRSMRKRPRRKFGERDMARLVNLSLAGAALLCIAFLAYWLRNNQDKVDTIIDERLGTPRPQQRLDIERATREWADFQAALHPLSRLSEAEQWATLLARQGDIEPMRVIGFLKRLQDPEPIEITRPQVVPQGILKRRTDSFDLALSSQEYTRVASLVLVPHRVVRRIAQISSLSLDYQGIAQETAGPSFSPSLFAAQAETLTQRVKGRVQSGSSDAIAAMDAFLAAKTAAASNEAFLPLLQIQRAFGLDDSASFLAEQGDGRYAPAAEASYGAYLSTLLSDYVLANLDDFRDTTVFRSALHRLATDAFPDSYAQAKAAYDAIDLAEPTGHARRAEWKQIADIWRENFVREDLMEQTIVAYTIEALERHKAAMLELQRQFTVKDLQDHAVLLDLEQSAQELIQIARSASVREEWIVFDSLNAQSNPSSP